MSIFVFGISCAKRTVWFAILLRGVSPELESPTNKQNKYMHKSYVLFGQKNKYDTKEVSGRWKTKTNRRPNGRSSNLISLIGCTSAHAIQTCYLLARQRRMCTNLQTTISHTPMRERVWDSKRFVSIFWIHLNTATISISLCEENKLHPIITKRKQSDEQKPMCTLLLRLTRPTAIVEYRYTFLFEDRIPTTATIIINNLWKHCVCANCLLSDYLFARETEIEKKINSIWLFCCVHCSWSLNGEKKYRWNVVLGTSRY